MFLLLELDFHLFPHNLLILVQMLVYLYLPHTLLLEKIFTENEIEMVIDFAAYKSVGDSVSKPIEYYVNNVSSVLSLLQVMKEHNVKTFIFSSSATVYGNPEMIPIPQYLLLFFLQSYMELLYYLLFEMLLPFLVHYILHQFLNYKYICKVGRK